MPALRDVGERGAIEAARAQLGRTRDLGRGEDDCAVVPLGGGRGQLLLVTTDVLIGRSHLLPGVTPGMLGAFAVEAAVSDVAAMGGTPLGVLCALGLPPGTDRAWLQALARAMARAARGHGVGVLGGDTKSATEPVLAMTALGTATRGECLFRRGARPGDALVLTGPVGGPGIGYQRLMASMAEGRGPDARALRLVYGVRARVRDGLALARTGQARACIDLSDGLALALHQLCEASGVGAEVHWDALPLAGGLARAAGQGRTELELALHFGGEYELLAAVRPDGVDEALAALRAARRGARCAVVGTVTRPREILLCRERARVPIRPVGFDHFRGA